MDAAGSVVCVIVRFRASFGEYSSVDVEGEGDVYGDVSVHLVVS